MLMLTHQYPPSKLHSIWLTLLWLNPFLNNVTLYEQFKKIDMYNLELFNFCGKQMKARTGFSYLYF